MKKSFWKWLKRGLSLNLEFFKIFFVVLLGSLFLSAGLLFAEDHPLILLLIIPGILLILYYIFLLVEE